MLKKNYLYFVYGLTLLGAAGVWWALAASNREPAPTPEGIEGRRAAPPVILQDVNGARFNPNELAGKVVIVHFWASWCAPCLEEIGVFLKAAEGYVDKPVRFLAVSLDEKWEDAWKLLPRTGLPAVVISTLDPEKAASDLYGSFQFPESYLLDKKQRIAVKLVGAQDWESSRMRTMIDQLLGEN